MKNIGVRVGVLSVVLTAACSSTATGTASTPPPPEPPFTACAIGQLRGTWRITHVQTNGTCGVISDETVVLAAPVDAGADAGPPPCVYASNVVSEDKCRIDLDYTCRARTDKQGSAHWVGVLHHTWHTDLNGTFTLQITEPAYACRSTYAVHWGKL